MKKTAIALIVAGLAAASVAQAAPQENTFYVGVKAGQASYHDGVREQAAGYHRNSLTYGVFGGYQVLNRNNFGLATELGYDFFGRMAYTDEIKVQKDTAHGVHLTLKGSYNLGALVSALEGLDFYGRAGVALVRSDIKVPDQAWDTTFVDTDEDGTEYQYEYSAHNGEQKQHSLLVSPVFAAGFEYALPSLPELAMRLEYQWVNKVGRFNDENGHRVDYSPSIGSINFGLSYRFGQGAPVVAPEVVSKTFNLNSDVTFAFGKANLKPQAKATLDGIYGEIAQINNANVAVAGYTDRIGSDAGNLKLSQRRADTVANYLVQKGVAADKISATGHGKANPVTGATCDQVKGRKALIACLAPDRRVEIAVNGTK